MKIITNRLRGLSFTAAASLLLTALPAWAVDPFTLRDIRVEGLQRVEPGTVFASLPFRIGEQYNDEKGSTAIRSLFGLGLFSDVRLQVNGDVLVVIVEERPTVADVSFSGIKEFDAEVLKKSLRDVGLAEGRPFDKALADRAEQELKRQYINRSMYAAQVATTVTPGERNRVNLNFSVIEGDVAKIKDIRIVGNQAFSEATLRNLFDLDTGGWLSWYTKSDRYSRAKLNADLENLRSHYLTRGYLEFRVDSTQVAISPDKQDMSVTINITEGNRFVVSSVALEGEYLGKEEEFKSLVTLKVGEAYNAEDVSRTVKAFTDYFGGFGYAFAQVEAAPEIDRVNNRVAFVLRAQPSRRVYVRRINVEGNNRTRDEVIRREFRQLESAWYDSDRIRLSRDRVDRLGFFTEVGIDTEPVPGTNDQVDLTVSVAEKPTGNLSIGAGYSQADKLSFLASIKQENVFGSGNYLGLDLNTSEFNRQFVLSTTNPYFTADGISRTFDLYYKTTRPYDAQGGDYQISTPGVGVRFGVPFTERDTVFFGLGAERVKVEEGDQLPEAYRDQGGTYLPATIGWARDERDSALVPSEGRLQRFNTEFGLGSDKRYVKLSYQFQQYVPLTRQYTLAFNTELGVGKGMGGKPYPVLRNFYGGGLGSVRGFEQGTLGPRSAVIGSTTGETVNIGGARNFVANLEFIAPFPGAGNDRTLRWFGFVDVGNVFGESQKVDFGEMRASVGVGLSWISPIGPLRFAYANPVRKFDGDRIQKFQFQIGTSF
ncbi:outer membrane protein assembly factor BamA [Hydrogenophaga sp.]|jgi:outer membrane protein insertion porin family|uniref:outer membrane protein assembly factor BamA n=1 Tax=Hydrogenophaga sp. TaxID=1904254 RepID=UPI002716540D|nr:outer membrane protein assembly factor BamA [Hydrogenophaga sp.]MDO9252662.1 outer membrane protein assembly factor BamA [Hydrogenophaga sp.]MDP2406446.1 outer membrane protein assembly factor BamA [Hydrogenophaga sp.]MDP3323409.1 outer membrane protein assembly factor BamA [Hydrogenophaga sp.]MDP3885383.1 outer membrane protein assembly factor BamA [Hydrogenophaga sp.]MDZ4177589.1 outer membrane protein assembly factor BamA [Hydrogenophaga sp.]